jgi:transposase
LSVWAEICASVSNAKPRLTGCKWCHLPKDFPPYSTVHYYFVWWQCDGVLDRIHHACREKVEREANPTAAIIGMGGEGGGGGAAMAQAQRPRQSSRFS